MLVLGLLVGCSFGAIGAELSKPEKNFEALWKTFHERYAFFKLRNVDWQKQYKIYRPKVTKDTTDEQLFMILCHMLKPLKDGHVNLKAKGLGSKKKTFNPEDTPRFFKEFNTGKLEKQFGALASRKRPPNFWCIHAAKTTAIS